MIELLSYYNSNNNSNNNKNNNLYVVRASSYDSFIFSEVVRTSVVRAGYCDVDDDDAAVVVVVGQRHLEPVMFAGVVAAN